MLHTIEVVITELEQGIVDTILDLLVIHINIDYRGTEAA
jgi:hypothetical protein